MHYARSLNEKKKIILSVKQYIMQSNYKDTKL